MHHHAHVHGYRPASMSATLSQVCPGVVIAEGQRLSCSGHGSCTVEKECACDAGWAGSSCSMQACPNECSFNGFCLNGTCYCASGFTGHDCSVRTCPEDCSHHGHCLDGVCHCLSTWRGPDCSLRTCPNECSSVGTCIDFICH